MNIYFISGLGADERVFQRLTLPQNWNLYYIKWPQIKSSETLQSYSKEIAKQIDSTNDFSLIGVSFGGILATEISKFLKPKHTIIISSISTKHELPWIYKMVGLLRLNKLVPEILYNKILPGIYWVFGVKGNSTRRLLSDIIKNTDPKFIKWAVNEIINWDNSTSPEFLKHIHGSKDKIFPVGNVKANEVVPNAGHLMVYVNAKIISTFIINNLVDS